MRTLREDLPGLTANETRGVQIIVGAKPDGQWGPLTTAKVKAWQAAHGLTADGVWGTRSQAAAAAVVPVVPGRGVELPNVITKVTTAQMLVALSHAWPHLFNGALPQRKSLDVLGAQWGLETGFGKSMHCNNVGNVKGKVGGERDWCFFACNEILTSASARHLAKIDPARTKITADNGKTATIWFYPNHSGCCFRAFKTLDEGAADYLALLYHRFNGAWQAVLDGDPEAFAVKLSALHYYTASVALYTSALKRCYAQVAGVKVDLETKPSIDPEALKALMLMTREESAELFDLENDDEKADASKDV